MIQTILQQYIALRGGNSILPTTAPLGDAMIATVTQGGEAFLIANWFTLVLCLVDIAEFPDKDRVLFPIASKFTLFPYAKTECQVKELLTAVLDNGGAEKFGLNEESLREWIEKGDKKNDD